MRNLLSHLPRNKYVNRLLRDITGQAIILLYHRVNELPSDPHLLCVSPKHFAEHLEHLQRHYNVISLRELVKARREGKIIKRAIVLTFDDGYADNLYNAKPLLERYGTPATVFVTTSHFGHEREFWWDELDRLLLQPGTLPKALHLSFMGGTYHWDLGRAAHYNDEDVEIHRHWNVLEKDDPTPRQHVYRSLCQLLRHLSDPEQRKVLHELLVCSSAESVVRPTHHALSREEVFRLAEGGLVEVGGHGVTHSVLSALPAAFQRDEINGGKASLEKILGHPVTSFSYPYGSPSDYTMETVALVQEAGFACACSNFAHVVTRGTDLFQLPRILVRDWDGEEFAHCLRESFRE